MNFFKRNILTVFSSLVLLSCAPPTRVSREFEASNFQSILNGKVVYDRTTPESKSIVMVVLMDSNREYIAICTGTLIAPNTVLSAAHCFDPRVVGKIVSSFDILFFETFFYRTGVKEVRHGLQVASHPKYNTSGKAPASYDHDVAVLRFAGTAPTGTSIAMIETNDRTDHAGKTVLSFGYGRSRDYTGESNELKSDWTGVLRSGTMKIDANYSQTDGQFYMTDPASMRHCQGDSGGPQFLRTKSGSKVVGVLSTTLGKRLPNSLQSCTTGSIATKISTVSDWVLQKKRAFSLK